MKKIGITGGIGSGKTFVANYFMCQYGIPVYFSDIQIKKIMNSNPEVIEKIKNNFGEESYFEGKLNRNHLVQKFFMHPVDSEKNVKIAEELLKPFLKKDFDAWCEISKELGEDYCLFESAIIFENKIENYFDKIITVIAPLDIRISRIKERDPFRSEQEIQNLLEKQMPQDEKACQSDFVINNSNNKNLEDQIVMINNFLSL